MMANKPGYRISDADRRHGFPAFESEYRHTYRGAESRAAERARRHRCRVMIESRPIHGGPWGDPRLFEWTDNNGLVHSADSPDITKEG